MNRSIMIVRKLREASTVLRDRSAAIVKIVHQKIASPSDRNDLVASLAGLTGSFLTIAATIAVMVYTTRPDRSATQASAVEETPKDPVALGKKLFVDRGCIGCHQLTGMGLPGQFPPLARSEWVQGDPERPIRILLNGLQGPTQIHGQTYNNAMPAFGSTLGDKEIAALLTYIRQEWGNSAPPVDTETVATVRAATKSRTSPWTSAELEAALARESEVGSPKTQVDMNSKESELAAPSNDESTRRINPAIGSKTEANKAIDPKP